MLMVTQEDKYMEAYKYVAKCVEQNSEAVDVSGKHIVAGLVCVGVYLHARLHGHSEQCARELSVRLLRDMEHGKKLPLIELED